MLNGYPNAWVQRDNESYDHGLADRDARRIRDPTAWWGPPRLPPSALSPLPTGLDKRSAPDAEAARRLLYDELALGGLEANDTKVYGRLVTEAAAEVFAVPSRLTTCFVSCALASLLATPLVPWLQPRARSSSTKSPGALLSPETCRA